MVEVRPVGPDDRAAWSGLFRDYGVFYEADFSDDIVDGVWAWLMDPDHPVGAFVATDAAETVIGFANVRELHDTFTAGNAYYLDDLYTAPEARGTGAATALIEAIRQESVRRGFGTLRWMTAADNDRAQRVYDRVATRTTWVTYEIEPA